PPASVPTRRGRGGRPHGLQRATGGARHGRPGAGHARGSPRRRAAPRAGHGRIRDVLGHRSWGKSMTRTLAPTPDLAAPTGATRTAQRFFVVRELGIALALVLLIAVTAIVNPRFLSAQSVKDLLLGSTILAITAIGQAVVIITRNVDLSVG